MQEASIEGLMPRHAGLVARLERQAAVAPGRYKLKVLALSLLGYAYPPAVLVGIVGTVGGAGLALVAIPGLIWIMIVAVKIGFKLLLPLLLLAGVILRACWIRLPPPDGLPLRRDRAPKLFALLDELRRKLHGPRIHRVLVTGDFNAGIMQVPRLGLAGWPENHLLLGLPLMQALSVAQFEAVLAHEYGHLAGAHGRLAGWIYRLRLTWARLADALDETGQTGGFLFRRFFAWYAPYFNAYSFVLARANEYDADRCSADVVGARVAAEALVDTAVRGRGLAERFWPSLFGQAEHEPKPPWLPYARMSGLFKEAGDADAGDLEQCLAETTTLEDTHPCLADRLRALGEKARPPRPVAHAAAEALLGDALPGLVARLDQDWHDWVLPNWTEQYQEAGKQRDELDTLTARFEQGKLDAEARNRHAQLTEAVQGSAVAEPLFRRLLEDNPRNPVANFTVGRIMLEQGDAQGLALLDTAMEFDADAIIPACEVAYDYLVGAGREADAERYRERALARHQLCEQALAERAEFNGGDVLLPHDLEPAAVTALVEQLRAVSGIGRAYLMCKQVVHMPEHPLYVLGLQKDKRAGGNVDIAEICETAAANMDLPGECFVVPLTWHNRRVRRVMEKTCDAPIYDRASAP